MSFTAASSGLLRDVRYGIRQFGRSPVLAGIVVLSLALGIGANTAIFSLVNAVMLQQLPIKDPARLVVFQYAEREGGQPSALDHTHSGRGSRDSAGRPVNLSISWPSFVYMQSRARTVESLVGYVPLGMFDKPLTMLDGEPTFIDGDMVTSGYFPALGVSPVLGRAVLPEDERPDAPRVAVISDRFWSRAYARSRDAIGKTLMVNGVPVTVIGVAPPAFTGLEIGRSPDVWIQMGPRPGLIPWGGRPPEGAPEAVYAAPDWWWLEVVGRLKPGVTVEQARAELTRLFHESLLVAAGTPVPREKLPAVSLTPAARGLNTLSQRFSTPLSILMVVVGLVLLVACANVATLLLARATARRKEMAVRIAMGAPRRRLVGQLLVESLLYAGAGAGVGLLFAVWGARALFVLITEGHVLGHVELEVRLDAAVLGFTAAVSLLTTVLFGLAPALRATRLDVAVDLKENAATLRGESGPGRLRGGKALVVAQIALSLPLVIGAGLALRTLDNLQRQPLGFDPEGILLFKLGPATAEFAGPKLVAACNEIRERVRALPNVRNAGASRLGLITGWVNNGSVSIEGDRPDVDPRTRRGFWNQVTPGFLETMGMGLVLGRTIEVRDTAAGPEVAVVNETMARQLFGSQNPIGRHFYFSRTPSGRPAEIVGVVRDAKYASLRAPAPPTAYVPYTQSRMPITAMFFQVRVAGDPAAVLTSIRKIVQDVAPGAPVSEVKTQARQIDESLGQETMYARLLSLFGAIALLLAAVGLYGTMAYALARRTREIGIRMALGAAQGRVLAGALIESAVMAVIGVSIGVLLAAAGARYVRSLLFEVTPFDTRTVAAAVLVMVAVALAAGYVPARRASRLDPLRALREE
jgi:macrolide transport system ATP-binding/permease protein